MKKYDFCREPSLLIQGAMDTETAYLAGQLEERECVILGNWKFDTGFLGTHQEPVIISRTFQGMVNAAAATSLALVHFCPKAVINQGIGGGHDPRFHRGDIVLGERVVPMGAMVRPFSAEGEGISERDFCSLPIEVCHRSTGKTEKVLDFPCDERLLMLAERAVERQEERKRGSVFGERNNACRIRRGIIGSADEWNNQLDRIALLRERYGTSVEDMESAAAAQLCFSYEVPFLGIRILSNSIVNGEEFDESVGVECQRFVLDFVEMLYGF